MSDREFMRKLADEVLGPDRNKLPDQSGDYGVKFTDDQVCKYFLVGFCPYLQFQNTKSDLGDCPKRYHEEKLRDKFVSEGEHYRAEYERDYLSFLERLVNDLERKLRRGKDRLDVKPNDPTSFMNPANDEFEERKTILDLQIKELLTKIEEYGEEGKIQEAQEFMQEVEKCKGELEKLRHMEAENPSYRLEKKMEVCQTCGAFLIVGDAQKRIEAHFEGKQHNGWARVREALAELKRKYSSNAYTNRHERERRPPPPSPQREPGEIGDEAMDRYLPSSGRYNGDRDHYERDYRDRDRDRDRDRGHHHRDRDRGHDSSRHRGRRDESDRHYRHHSPSRRHY